jgi:hypothetical protein
MIYRVQIELDLGGQDDVHDQRMYYSLVNVR